MDILRFSWKLLAIVFGVVFGLLVMVPSFLICGLKELWKEAQRS